MTNQFTVCPKSRTIYDTFGPIIPPLVRLLAPESVALIIRALGDPRDDNAEASFWTDGPLMKLDKHPDTTSPRGKVDLVIFYRPYHNFDISVRVHAPSSASRPIVRITTRIRTTHVHPCDRPRSTNAGSTFPGEGR